ncbi:hypothetical protein FY528_05685 [Hymenobacter lutimineralis]|uniref:Uncharacterized protein n=1 Tax=Hymenobacter lutimineralis TaxID=2606448 RepID=A0A5D6VAI7_9BACT|nr:MULTISPECIES: hypothetical protein [Hymenobacter]QIX62589.1 hypothetical protein HER32_15970 [Hymenobacter sp. BT18]TYZ11849.1 hypothetical protein FY528_05685 [Hymenobacter lutimineralis]
MAFTGAEGGPIEVTTAAGWTANYRAEHPDEITAYFFGKNILQRLLSQSGCVGIRIYYGQDSAGVPKLVLVGADANQNDMLGGRIVADSGLPQPPSQGVNCVLNC